MKEQLIRTVSEKMYSHLTIEQVHILERTLSLELDKYNVELKRGNVIVYDGNAEQIVKSFLIAKHISGCSDKTIAAYKFNLQKFVLNLRRPILETETNDIRYYLAMYKERRKVSNATLNNMRASLSSFFTWLHDEGVIDKNPKSRYYNALLHGV